MPFLASPSYSAVQCQQHACICARPPTFRTLLLLRTTVLLCSKHIGTLLSVVRNAATPVHHQQPSHQPARKLLHWRRHRIVKSKTLSQPPPPIWHIIFCFLRGNNFENTIRNMFFYLSPARSTVLLIARGTSHDGNDRWEGRC